MTTSIPDQSQVYDLRDEADAPALFALITEDNHAVFCKRSATTSILP